MEKISRFLTKDKQKQRNLSDILNYIIEKGETTRREIERDTGFSWGAVSESVSELLARGYIYEEMPSEKTVGRTSANLKLSGDNIVSVGIDVNISGITARIIGFDLSKKWKLSLPCTATTQEELLREAMAAAESAFEFCEGKYRVFSLGIAIQGKVDNENGISVYFPNIPKWQSVNIKEMFEERFGVPTSVEHDPRCLLFSKNARSKIRDALLLRLDNGIGLSVIQDGKILNDFGRMEIGHTIAVKNGERCICGRRGCLEAYASIIGIERRKKKKFSELTSLSDASVFYEACEHLSVAIYNLSMLFAPQKIVITGALSEEEGFISTLRSALDSFGDFEPVIEVDNNISASMGAALLSIKSRIKTDDI